MDVHSHSLSLYTGTGTRRHTAHLSTTTLSGSWKLESILKIAGQNDIVAEDADVFKWCICNEARRERHVKAMGARGTRRDAHGIRPDLSALRSERVCAWVCGGGVGRVPTWEYARGICEIFKRL